MIPAANLLGFAGQELARKLPHVLGVLLETTLGSVVELILLITLIVKHYQHEHDPTNNTEITITVIRAAILGSILANLLLCLGLCFIAGGMRHEEQVFHEAISEVGSNLLLVAGCTYNSSPPLALLRVTDLAQSPSSSLQPSLPRRQET